MKKLKKILTTTTAFLIVINSASCASGNATRPEANSQTTTVNTTILDTDKELETEVNWEEMAEIEKVDISNEVGTGPLYETGKTAGVVKALCYYDLATTQPELAELLAQRYGGTIETEITTSGSSYFERLGVLIAAGDSPDIIRYEWMAYPMGASKNMFTPLDEWLDIDSPLWVEEKDVIDSFNYLGQHFYFRLMSKQTLRLFTTRQFLKSKE